jgi:hypothetical protein
LLLPLQGTRNPTETSAQTRLCYGAIERNARALKSQKISYIQGHRITSIALNHIFDTYTTIKSLDANKTYKNKWLQYVTIGFDKYERNAKVVTCENRNEEVLASSGVEAGGGSIKTRARPRAKRRCASGRLMRNLCAEAGD